MKKSAKVKNIKRPRKPGRKPLFSSRITATRAYHKLNTANDELQGQIIKLNTETEQLREGMKKLMGNPYMWITQQGVRILPSQMETSHLQNTICMLQRKLVHRIGTVTWMNDVFFQVEALYHMLQEAQKRGLRV